MDTEAADRLWERQLHDGLREMGIELDAPIQRSLLAFLGLLKKWNRAYNLTAVRDESQAVSRQLLDSLSILPFIRANKVLDVGSGGGLPGIPLALARPDVDFTLMDSNGKKTRFLNQCVLELELKNVTVIQGRVEDIPVDEPFEQITCRAFTALSNLVTWCDHLLASGGEFLAMKGQFPDDEVRDLPETWTVFSQHVLTVPGTEGDRHCLVVRRRSR